MNRKVFNCVIMAAALSGAATACAQRPFGTDRLAAGDARRHSNLAVASATGIRWGKPVRIDNFRGTTLNRRRWFIYADLHPRPGHPRRSAKAVRVRHGELQLIGHVDPRLGDVSGGIGDRFHQAYGRWKIRFRADPGRGYAAVVLLWPSDENWPDEGEIDLAEVFDSTRQSAAEFLHYGHDNHQTGHRIKADFTRWHVITVDWLPSHITFWLDGHKQRTVVRQANPRKNLVPSTPFRLGLQNDQGCSGYCHRDKTTPKYVIMHVDWVKIYAVPSGVR